MNGQATTPRTASWRKRFLLLIACWFPAFWTVTVFAEQPSFLIVLADDLGYGDLGYYGRKDAHTPNLDRFAKEGLRLTIRTERQEDSRRQYLSNWAARELKTTLHTFVGFL